MTSWEDLKIVLAIHRAGNLSKAARSLGVDQTTVSRRLSSIERSLGHKLFIRKRPWLLPTEATERALPDIEAMETSAFRFLETFGATLSKTEGQVRIASTPWVFNHLVVPLLPKLHRVHPGIELNLIADVRERSLSDREAEIALRFEMKPRGQEIEIELARVPYSVYAHVDTSPDDLPWIGSAIDSGKYAPQSWLERQVDQNSVSLPLLSHAACVLFDAALHKLGKCLLPEILGDSDSNLHILPTQDPVLVRRLRLLVHPTVSEFLRVSVVIDWLRSFLPSYLEGAK